MHRPPVSSPYDSPPRPSPSNPPSHPSQNPHPQQQQQQHSYQKHYSHDAPQYDQPSYPYGNVPRASHLHLPGVNTYIEHYHYYNFNGNCTVQQASGDGHPNTNSIHMTPSSARQPHYSSHNALDVPPVPPPLSHPLQPPQSDPYPLYSHRNPDHRNPHSAPPHQTSLPHPHLAPLSTSRSIPATAQLPPHTSFLDAPRLVDPPPTIPHSTQLQPQPPLLPRLRNVEPQPPILAPLQSAVPSALSPLHADEKLSNRPTKRSRLSRPAVNIPLPTQGATVAPPVTAPPTGGSDSNCPSAADDRVIAIPRGATYATADRPVHTTNSSSPSHGDYPLAARTDGFERTSSGVGRATRNADESQSNDWEAVVEMYTTGKGTEDGVALKMITKGDGRRVSDRKLLEKRRTIGKTYECLGVERFERAIGYKWENGVRRKQKMYHVISRCRVVNAMRKSGESIPTDCDELTRLINGRIAEKEALKAGMTRRSNVGASGSGPGRIGPGGAGGLGTGMGYAMDDLGRMRGVGSHVRESGVMHGELGSGHGGRSENEGDLSGGRRLGHGGEGGSGGRDEDEIRPGRAHHDGGRYG